MEHWVRLCRVDEAPPDGQVAEKDAAGVAVCLANVDGKLAALDNWCPHRRGALGQGWVEGNAVVCPLHSWTFNVDTGKAEPPDSGEVAVFPVQTQDGYILVDIG